MSDLSLGGSDKVTFKEPFSALIFYIFILVYLYKNWLYNLIKRINKLYTV